MSADGDALLSHLRDSIAPIAEVLTERDYAKALRDVMALHPIREIPHDDPRIAVDIDTPEDFERARRWLDDFQFA